MVLGEAGHTSMVWPRLLPARRTSSVNSSVSDYASHEPGSARDAEAKGRGMRRCTSERSFRGPNTAAVRGAGVEGSGGGMQAATLQPQLPQQPQLPITPLSHASPSSDVDKMLYPASTSLPTPLSAPHSSPHTSPHTPGPHSGT